MTLPDEQRLRLAHDVGKYIVRAALNLPREGEVPDVLIEMLIADLYGDERHPAALATFDALLPNPSEPSSREARRRLVRITALEPRVREGDLTAVREAAAEALEVAALLGAS